MKKISNSLEDTKKIAEEICEELKNMQTPFYILMSGDLGAGKTTFSKQLIKLLGVDEVVTSPTFVIMNQYTSKSGLTINHMDAYRLKNDSELDMYLDEFENSINIIEWYENIDLESNINYLKIDIKNIGDHNREFTIERN
ncbi:tRNA (adenosine(37)-N6)-threonylcarbamoyltransferase complex ATPase subunit type 1 TsaE [Mesoplasma photuris]|uniref:tRNA (adenosine(37)-N6)-threonylcarbamoyltransferase complex ATPase subunit type 1 TsaE n=1 Tax=Mesoplasma photuris TaxID=217731 RepID=UPI0004E23B35|nr:tRNA (adenosine(37)-N6)-threonylcarbamoyltransferase complex ATPase subunit type 1 TsaE [Mesoplasma photuris]